jgi:hypothetical protein
MAAFVSRPAAPEFPVAPMSGNHMGEDLMTRRQVASLFRVTSAAVATWARRGRLPEVRDEAGRPRYRRGDVEALLQRGFGGGKRDDPAPGMSPEGGHRHDRAVRPVQDS